MENLKDRQYAIPYVGVCDVPSKEAIAELRLDFSLVEPLRLKAGVTMTRKVLWGIPSQWKNVCPPKCRIRDIFDHDYRMVMNVIHYADYDGVDLEPSLERVITLGGPNLHGVQLDMVWPKPAILEEFRKKYPKLFFILQIGDRAIQMMGEQPLRVWQAVENYDGIVEYFLLDRSMGQGKPLDARSLVRFVDILYERMRIPGVGIAGGLGPDTVHLVEPPLAMYPRLSVDAQGQLRESGRTLDGPISLERAQRYTRAMTALHRKHNVMS